MFGVCGVRGVKGVTGDAMGEVKIKSPGDRSIACTVSDSEPDLFRIGVEYIDVSLTSPDEERLQSTSSSKPGDFAIFAANLAICSRIAAMAWEGGDRVEGGW